MKQPMEKALESIEHLYEYAHLTEQLYIRDKLDFIKAELIKHINVEFKTIENEN